MDVLQLLKMEFKARMSDMSELMGEPAPLDAEALLKRFRVQLAWEANYLFPEIAAISSRNDGTLNRYAQNLQELRQALEACLHSDENLAQWQNFGQAFIRHGSWVEDKILPLMRQKIPTGDREDLYHVFADAKLDLSSGSAIEFAI